MAGQGDQVHLSRKVHAPYSPTLNFVLYFMLVRAPYGLQVYVSTSLYACTCETLKALRLHNCMLCTCMHTQLNLLVF